MAEKVTIGNCELWHGDCRELRHALQPVDAVISDPPYGQRLKTNIAYASGTKKRMVPQRGGGALEVSPQIWPDTIHGDDEPFDPAPWLALAPRVLLWGAHKFHDRLPDGGTWLVWDKVPTGKLRDQGDGEAAWLNVPGANPTCTPATHCNSRGLPTRSRATFSFRLEGRGRSAVATK